MSDRADDLRRAKEELRDATDTAEKRTALRRKIRDAAVQLLGLAVDVGERVLLGSLLAELEKKWGEGRP